MSCSWSLSPRPPSTPSITQRWRVAGHPPASYPLLSPGLTPPPWMLMGTCGWSPTGSTTSPGAASPPPPPPPSSPSSVSPWPSRTTWPGLSSTVMDLAWREVNFCFFPPFSWHPDTRQKEGKVWDSCSKLIIIHLVAWISVWRKTLQGFLADQTFTSSLVPFQPSSLSGLGKKVIMEEHVNEYLISY